MEVRSASVAMEAPRCPKGWSASLRRLWRFSSSLTADREVAIKPDDSAARLFSEAGSSPDLRLFSPTAGLSLYLGGAGLACCCC